MRVIIANPDQDPCETTVESGLHALQAAVGGYIELWAVDGDVCFICNEEGRINGMPFNRTVVLSDGSEWDIFGPILLVRESGEDFASLTDEDVAQWLPQLASAV
jgi:hypothetical protein